MKRLLSSSSMALAVAATCVLSVPAWGQTTLTPPPGFDPDTMELAEPARPGSTASVDVKDLKAPSIDQVGVLDSSHGGFANTLWAGTTAPVVRALLPMLPANPASPALRGVQRRLLLTAATPPDGNNPNEPPSLVELRVGRLMAMGAAQDVISLANAVPNSASRPLLARNRIDAQLLAGQTKDACADVLRLPTAGDDGLAKIQVLCNYLSGKVLEGNLGLDLLRERKDADHGFIAAAEVVAGLPPIPADKIKLAELTPVHVAAFSAAKLPVPADALAKASPAAARALAMSFGTPIDARINAGERAEAAGLLPPDSLRQLYLEAAFTPDELANAAQRAESLGARARPLLYRAAHDQADPVLRATLVAKALDMAEAQGQTLAIARLYAPMIEAALPNPALRPQSPAFARAALALGKPDVAARWLELARTSPDTQFAIERLWPLMAVQAAQPGQPLSTGGLAAWRSRQVGLPPETVARRAAVVFGLLSALGAKIPDSAWVDTLTLPAGGPQPGLFALMQNAALESRLGIAVLASLAALGDTPLDKADPTTMAEVVSALSVVGLGEDARRLTIEAMLANGV